MSVMSNSMGLTKLILNHSKLISGLYKSTSYHRSFSSQMNVLSRLCSPLLRQKIDKTCLGSAWLEHVSPIHTKGDKELVEFITEEIKAELKLRKHHQPPPVEGFEVKTNGAEVIMTKKFNSENITVTMNVNHSVDAEESDDSSESKESHSEEMRMQSKPNFNVEIEKGGKNLAFSCSISTDMMPDEQSQDSYSDAFQITELTMYDKEWEDETYSVSGDIMDGLLYDLLMNMLEERGISNEFADRLVEYCTSYEHSLYIGLLEELKDFVSKT